MVLITPLIGPAMQLVTGGIQLLSRKKNKRPEFVDDSALTEFLNLRRLGLNDPMPGYDQAKENAESSVALARDAIIKKSASAVPDVESLARNAAIARRSVDDSRSRLVTSERDKFGQGLRAEQAYNEAKFKFEKGDPYTQQAAANSALTEGGLTNLFNAGQNLANYSLLKEWGGVDFDKKDKSTTDGDDFSLNSDLMSRSVLTDKMLEEFKASIPKFSG